MTAREDSTMQAEEINEMIDPAALVRHQAHSAIQWLARLAHSFLPPNDDQSHLLLTWHAKHRAIVSPVFAEEIVVEFRLNKCFLHFREHDRPTLHPLLLDDISPAEIEAWMLIELLHRNLDRDRFSKDLPYDVSALMGGDAEHFRLQGLQPEFDALESLIDKTVTALKKIGDPVFLRPRDFAVFVHSDKSQALVEAGICLGDQNAREPYFYAHDFNAPGPSANTAEGFPLNTIPAISIETLSLEELANQFNTLVKM